MADRLSPGNRRIRLTSSGWSAVVGAAVMFGLAIQTSSVWMQAVGAALIGLLAVSLTSVVRPRAEYLATIASTRQVRVGEPVDTQLKIENPGRRATPPLRIIVSRDTFDTSASSRRATKSVSPRDNAELVGPAHFYVDPVAPFSDASAHVSRPAERRGVVGGWRISVEAIAPFGFFRLKVVAFDSRELIVGPPSAEPLDLARVTGATADGTGPVGTGFDVRGVREWRPGDAARHVHWRTTARTGVIAVLEHGEPTIGSMAVLVAGVAGDPQFERGIAVAAATTLSALHDGLAVVGLDSQARVRDMTVASWHRAFAELGTPAVPTPDAVDRLLAVVGSGGAVLLVVGSGVSAAFRAHVEAASSAVGAVIVDVLGVHE